MKQQAVVSVDVSGSSVVLQAEKQPHSHVRILATIPGYSWEWLGRGTDGVQAPLYTKRWEQKFAVLLSYQFLCTTQKFFTCKDQSTCKGPGSFILIDHRSLWKLLSNKLRSSHFCQKKWQFYSHRSQVVIEIAHNKLKSYC